MVESLFRLAAHLLIIAILFSLPIAAFIAGVALGALTNLPFWVALILGSVAGLITMVPAFVLAEALVRMWVDEDYRVKGINTLSDYVRAELGLMRPRHD